MKENPTLQQTDVCYKDDGTQVNTAEVNCTRTQVGDFVLSDFNGACPNGRDYVTIRDPNGQMVPLYSRELCYDDPTLIIRDGDILFHGKNDHGIYETPLGPAPQPVEPVPATLVLIPTATLVLIPTATPLPPDTTLSYETATPQPLIEVHRAPEPGCWGFVPLGLLGIGAMISERRRKKRRLYT